MARQTEDQKKELSLKKRKFWQYMIPWVTGEIWLTI
jgi:hypothetical protein